jgi:hypothetical protein
LGPTIFASSLQVIHGGPTSALPGQTPEPCSNLQLGFTTLSPYGEVNGIVNGRSGVTIDGRLAYQINEARVGPDGQAANKYLNHSNDSDPSGVPYTPSTAMAWVWNVIQFDMNGTLQPFNNGSGAVVTTNNLAMFPTITVYRNGVRLDPVIPQQSVDIFTPLDFHYIYGGPQ